LRATTAITTKDLINVGLFTVLYIGVVALLGQLFGLTPITQVLGPLVIPILAGVPFVLFLTRVHRYGLVTLMGLLIGLAILATGQSFWVLVVAVVAAPLADLILRAGGYRRWATTVLGYVVFSETLIGTVIPLFFARDAFLERIGRRHDPSWIEDLVRLTPSWMFFAMIAMLAVGAVIGAALGRALLRKHFEPAGIAPRGDPSPPGE
jgi:energy-coupling factor transport system substrate-specific component